MQINQHNYEEFFLLYVDGELSAADQQAVEQFVQANPGLADELEMIQQMKLPDDTVLFDDKAVLFRNGATEISADNCETQFLLYVDNELDAAERTAVEMFVLQHPAVQEPFMLLKKAKLEPETVLFPGKESLYRKEKKERPVIYLRWQRVAVAAALTGVAVLVWTLFPSTNNEGSTGSLAVNQPAGAAKSGPPQINTPGASKPAANNKPEETIRPSIALNSNVGKERRSYNVVSNTLPAGDTRNGLLARNDAQPTVNAPAQETITPSQELTNTATLSGSGIQMKPNTEPANAIMTENNESGNTTASNLVQPAVYKELDTDDEKKSLYVGSLEINKDKLRGFFRKATSLFRGKAKQQEEDRAEATPASSNSRSLK